MNKDSINEMDQIEKGLEEFLEKEVAGYREMNNGQGTAQQWTDQQWTDQPCTDQPEWNDTGKRQSEPILIRTTADRQPVAYSQPETVKKQKKVPQGKGEQNVAAKKRKKKKKRKSFFKRFFIVVLILCLAAGGVWYYSVNRLYQRVQFQPIESVTTEPMKEEGVINILLIGNDSRDQGTDGRSDAMILLSISNATKTIHLTSLLRDMYVEIPGYQSNRLNAAYSYGGPELLMETLEQNFDISVNRYVLVNFQAFANVVDAVGGVDLELTNEEVQYINGYLVEYNILEGNPEGTYYLDTSLSGLVHLNGPQALSYCRNRMLGTDFARTERQRKVLSAIIAKAPSALLTNTSELIDSILPNLTTNLTEKECRNLTLQASKLLTYDVIQGSVPVEGSYKNASIRGMSVLEVDFDVNKEYLRNNIYGEESAVSGESVVAETNAAAE